MYQLYIDKKKLELKLSPIQASMKNVGQILMYQARAEIARYYIITKIMIFVKHEKYYCNMHVI